jgi:hypothetical protein
MNSMERLSEYLNVEQESNTNNEGYAPPEKVVIRIRFNVSLY